METELDRHLRTEREMTDRICDLAGQLAALKVCLEFAVEYCSHGTIPSPETIEVWRETIAESKVKP